VCVCVCVCVCVRARAQGKRSGGELGFDGAISRCRNIFSFILEQQFSLAAKLDLIPESVCVCVAG
jgi:hypothetical protein